MNKNTVFKIIVLFGLVGLFPSVFAQKPTDIYGKSSTARTDTVPVTNVQPPTEINSGTPTPTPTPPPGANSTISNTSNTSTPTPTPTPDTTVIPVKAARDTPSDTSKVVTTVQVGGVNQNPIIVRDDGGGNKGGKGGKHHRPKRRMRLPNPASQELSEVTVPVVGGDQTSDQNGVTSGAVAVEKKSCEDEALKEIYKIMSADQNNAFAKMFELTVMRLAKKALSEGNITLEGYTRNKITEIEQQMNAVKTDVNVQNQVKAAYEIYGKAADIAVITSEVDKTLAVGKKACYFSTNTRMWNDQVSSYVLAASITDQNSGLTEADASIIWAVEKIRAGAGATYKNGTANGNLLNVSNRVARYLGTIQGGSSISKEELDKKLVDQEQELVELISNAYAQVKTSLFACIDQANPSCAQCAIDQKSKFETDHLGLASIQRGLAGAVAKSENAKVEKSLKGKVGEISFDFSKTLAKGTVVQVPERMNKFDACGTKKPQ